MLDVRGIIYMCIPKRKEWKNEHMPTVESIWLWLLVEEEENFVKWPETIKAGNALCVATISVREH